MAAASTRMADSAVEEAAAASAESVLMLEGPVQFISVNDEGSAFILHEKKLAHILDQVPKEMKVSVVCIAGAFRTGKSFMLDLMLRYLRYYDEHPEEVAHPTSLAWMRSMGATLEGSANTQQPLQFGRVSKRSYSMRKLKHIIDAATVPDAGSSSPAPGARDAPTDEAPVPSHTPTAASGHRRASTSGASSTASGTEDGRSGFKWRSGKERMTTGIWMWSRPFLRTCPSTGERVAVLLIDTQGLFDSETSQMLTTCIFGLSTLISSHIVYNLQGRIQEDHLQNLALFSEYGRCVSQQERSASAAAAPTSGRDAAAAARLAALGASEEYEDADTGYDGAPAARAGAGSARTSATSGVAARVMLSPTERLASAARQRGITDDGSHPFQHVQLLVRDFPLESEVDEWPAVDAEMKAYLSSIMAKDKLEDLRTVREHIRECFESISCFLLPHPGLHVTRKDYNGDLASLQPDFCALLGRFMHKTFHDLLQPKRMNNMTITAPQLKRYVEAYARLFQDQAIFPKAQVLLAATAEANSRSAMDIALDEYDATMRHFIASGFHSEAELLQRHSEVAAEAMLKYNTLANFGSITGINKVRDELVEALRQHLQLAKESNAARNPWRNAHMYIFAIAVAVGAYMLKMMSDMLCASWSSVCARGSQMLGFVYTSIFAVLVGIAIYTGSDAWTQVRGIIGLVTASLSGGNVMTAIAQAQGTSSRGQSAASQPARDASSSAAPHAAAAPSSANTNAARRHRLSSTSQSSRAVLH